jgi:hypothetical protein
MQHCQDKWNDISLKGIEYVKLLANIKLKRASLDYYPCFYAYINHSLNSTNPKEILNKEFEEAELKVKLLESRLKDQYFKAVALETDFQTCYKNAQTLFGNEYLNSHNITLNCSIMHIGK